METLNRALNSGEGLVQPMRRKSDPPMGPDVIMAMVPSDLDFLVNISQAKKRDFSDMKLYNLYQTEEDPEVLVTLTGPFLGAPQAVMGMEKMIALGAQRIWTVGWCGSLQPNLRIGDLVMPSTALSEEGTSHHYPIGENVPSTDEELGQILGEALAKQKQSFVRGPVWTTDAPYRETPLKVKAYQERDILAVEMEMSALMTLAIYRAVKLSGLLVVSDELFDLEWHSGFSSPKRKKTSRLAGEVLLNLVESLQG